MINYGIFVGGAFLSRRNDSVRRGRLDLPVFLFEHAVYQYLYRKNVCVTWKRMTNYWIWIWGIRFKTMPFLGCHFVQEIANDLAS